MKPRIRKTQVKHFTRSEEKTFWKAVEQGSNPRDILIFDILFDTGLSLSELTGLNVEDVSGKNYLTVAGKGRKERTIPIGSIKGLKKEIQTFLEWKQSHGESIHPRSPLFCSRPNRTRKNKRLSNRAIQFLVNRYSRDAGLERHFHPHACRHTFGFKLGSRGVPIQVII